MKKRILALCMVAVSLLLGACSTGADLATLEYNDFIMSCPKSWRARTADTDSTSTLVQIYLPEKDNFTSNIVVTVQNVSGLKASDFNDTYAQDLVDSSSSSLDVAFTLDSCEHVTLGNKDAVMIRYHGTTNGVEAVITEQLIPLETKLYRITYTQMNPTDAVSLESVMSSVVFK